MFFQTSDQSYKCVWRKIYLKRLNVEGLHGKMENTLGCFCAKRFRSARIKLIQVNNPLRQQHLDRNDKKLTLGLISTIGDHLKALLIIWDHLAWKVDPRQAITLRSTTSSGTLENWLLARSLPETLLINIIQLSCPHEEKILLSTYL